MKRIFIKYNIYSATLYIPSVFFSWDGATLDQKLPLLRANESLERETLRLLSLIGDNTNSYVITESGPEQEFFLIDRDYYNKRPDLKICGRTLFGAAPPKGQELEDQYFGDMSYKALNCMNDVEKEAWKLGIPVVTRHREVAPGQYELAIMYDNSLIAGDQNLMIMEILKKVSQKHHQKALFHEKPFARVNGSGKHNNWSMSADKAGPLFRPGNVAEKNTRFMLFLAAVIRGVDLHSDLLRLSASGASNDHRLGANEAPPAIMSMFLGDDLLESLNKYISGNKDKQQFLFELDLGAKSLPSFKRDTADRNRTSPFAFCGNKFEFRAVGSSQSVARSNLMITTIMADSIKFVADELQKKLGNMKVDDAVHEVVKEIIQKHSRIIFNGNNYAKEWQQEAAKRGLPNYPTTPDVLPEFTSEKNINLFQKLNIMNKKELESRKWIMADEYVKKTLVEAKMASFLTRRYILPSAYKVSSYYHTGVSFGENCSNFYKAFSETVNSIEKKEYELKNLVTSYSTKKLDPLEEARSIVGDLIPLQNELREVVDRLENMVDVKEWPLPTYHNMLFNQS